MPRIYTSSSDPLDFCVKHFPSEDEAIRLYGNVGDGPDGRGNCFDYASDHPTYDDPSMYTCYVCRKTLTEFDD